MGPYDSNYHRQYYADNVLKMRQKRQQTRKKQVARNKAFVKEVLSKSFCVDCGQVDSLEFDHVRGKKIDCISNLVGQGAGLVKLEAEIAKCDVRCSKCHKKKTAERRNDAERQQFSAIESIDVKQGMLF